MEIQDAKQARPHCELIAELLDSRQPKTEREHAAVREIERLRHDIERHVEIACELATECERLRAELAACREDAERYRWLRDKADSNFVCWADLRDFGSYDAEDIDKKIDAARKGEGA